jgi:hypothetical protein
MNDKEKYNLDELLRAKPFSKLNEDERTFALGLCESAEQYEVMRSAALFSESVLVEDESAPPLHLKATVMSAFEEKHHQSSGKKVIPFHTEKKSWHQYSLVRIGIAAALIGVLFMLLPLNVSRNEQIAEKKSKPNVSGTKIEKQENAITIDKDSSVSDETITETDATKEADETQEEVLAELKSEEASAEKREITADLDISEPILDVSRDEKDEIAIPELAAVSDSEDSEMGNAYEGSEDVAKTSSAPKRMQSVNTEKLMQETVTLSSQKKSKEQVSFQLSEQTGWQKHHYTAW